MILYETLNQPLIFLIIFCVGFVSGLIFDASKYLTFLFNKNKVFEKIFDAISVALCSAVFFACLLELNYGEFRFYILLGYVLGVLIERITLGLIVAKICSLCYNAFKKLMTKLSNKIFKKKSNENNE